MILKTTKMLVGVAGIVLLVPLNVIAFDVHHTIWRTEKILYDEIYRSEAKNPGLGVARLKPLLPTARRTKDRKIAFRKLSKRDQKRYEDLTGCSRMLKSMLQLLGEGCYAEEISELKAMLFHRVPMRAD